MPNDLFAIKKIYPDSKIAYKFFHYTKGLKRNVEPTIPVIETSIPEFFEFSDFTVAPELKVIARGSEYFANGGTNENYKIAIQQKFMSAISDYKNFEAYWYLKFFEGTDPFCIYGRATGRRDFKKPCLGMSYRAYLKPGGQVRLCKETFFGNKAFASDWKQVIASLTEDQICGMKFIVYNINNDTAVKLELWIDEFAKNDWKLVDSFTDMGNNWGTGATKCGAVTEMQPITWGGPVVSFCTEGSSPSSTKYSFTKATVREINPGGAFAEARAGSAVATAEAGGGTANAFADAGGNQGQEADTGGGLDDGAGGIADDDTTGTGENNEDEPIFTIQPEGSAFPSGFPFPFPPSVGTGGSTSAPVGSPSTGTDITPTEGSNQTPEKPLVTVYSDLGLLYNIVLDSESPCDVGSPFKIDYRQVYSVSGTDTVEIKMYNGPGGVVRAGAKAHSSASVLCNKIFRKVTVPLRKFGNPTSGYVGLEIRDRLGNLMHTFATTIDPAIISTGPFGPTYEFVDDANKHRFQPGDMLLLTYHNAVDANLSNCIILKGSEKDEIDGFDTIEVRHEYQGSIYKVDQDRDWAATLFV